MPRSSASWELLKWTAQSTRSRCSFQRSRFPGKGTHDVLFVATEHDSVYAFDANRPGDPPLWQVRLLDPARENPLTEDQAQCPFIRPEIGITSTPVIDLPSGTLYVLARSVARHTTAADDIFSACTRSQYDRGRKIRRP